jgi:RNA polymerase sigma-70 factor (ECF subfamily)
MIIPLPSRPEATIDPTVRAAQQGDELAFGLVYDRNASRVYAICLRMSGNPQVAAELLQDVFVRVWERIGTFKGQSSFGTWLHRLAINVVLEAGRKGRRRRARVTGVADLSVDPPDHPSATVDPGVRIDLEHALASLPQLPRQVFTLHDIEGYPHAEIANILGMVEPTVRSHLFRARRQLRGLLS